ncbi:dnaJ homolog subfamily C member 1 [Nilaparvata lugens]|uniref:dnaJ homolog subfamily C member 1 n=1 Tax=Nilaparvata lugens TaxID=108931 RepID=UPI00193D100A|nr:dnaJ homolog subfamily C member 1 [Nilaparvata lugens]
MASLSGSSFSLPFLILVFIFGITSVFGFATDEMEVFDAVEEINQNFYTLLDIPQNADASAIKKAFRRLSLVLHPDKNDAPDAEVQFRQLVAMYDILKDPNKRRCYDNVLVNGLPDWRQAVYYYRRVRKMGLAEMTAILFVIISIGQYLVGWAAYLEKKYTVEEYLSTKSRKLHRKQKKNKGDTTSLIQEFEIELEKPSAMDTLPFQIPRLIWFLLVSAPPLTYQWLREYLEERQRQKLLQAEEQDASSEEDDVPPQPRQPRRRKPAFSVPEIKDGAPAKQNGRQTASPPPPTAASPPPVSGGLWTDDDLLELTRLVKKYPMGTLERWERIGEALGRSANEVAHMAHKVKDNMVRTLTSKRQQRRMKDDSEEEEEEDSSNNEGEEGEEMVEVEEEPRKVKTKGGKHGAAGEGAGGKGWSQLQQKALETALAKYPKNSAQDRWDKIAKCVPGKTKEECMQRFKHLVDIVKKKKDQETNNAESTQDTQQCVQATESAA